MAPALVVSVATEELTGNQPAPGRHSLGECGCAPPCWALNHATNNSTCIARCWLRYILSRMRSAWSCAAVAAGTEISATRFQPSTAEGKLARSGAGGRTTFSRAARAATVCSATNATADRVAFLRFKEIINSIE